MPERCIDACLAIKWVVAGEAYRKKARQFLVDSLASGFQLIAPPIFEYETESMFQAELRKGTLTISQADTATG